MSNLMTQSEAHIARRKNDPAGVRGRILDAAFELFQRQGYNATSVHEIAAEARVTGGALHHHFPSKKALGLAVIEERVAAAGGATRAVPGPGAPQPPDGHFPVLLKTSRGPYPPGP